MKNRRRRRFVARDRKKTVIRLCILLLVPLLLAGGIYGGIRLLRGRGRAALRKAPFTAGDAYAYNGKGFLYYQNGKLVYADDADSKKNYSLSISTTSTDVGIASGPGMDVLYNASSVRVVGAESAVELGGVQKVICGSGHFAVFATGGPMGECISVYNTNAVQADEIPCAIGYLTDFGLDMTNEETLWTLSLSVTGGIPISTLTTYNLAQAVTNGLILVQEELVEKVSFTASSIFVSGTTHIIRYDRAGNAEVYRVLIYGWQVMDFQTLGGPKFLLRARAEDGFESVRICSLSEGDAAGEKIATVQLPTGTLSAFLCGGGLAVFTADTLFFYNAEGVLQSEQPLSETIESAEKLSDTRALLRAGDEMFVLDIK